MSIEARLHTPETLAEVERLLAQAEELLPHIKLAFDMAVEKSGIRNAGDITGTHAIIDGVKVPVVSRGLYSRIGDGKRVNFYEEILREFVRTVEDYPNAAVSFRDASHYRSCNYEIDPETFAPVSPEGGLIQTVNFKIRYAIHLGERRNVNA